MVFTWLKYVDSILEFVYYELGFCLCLYLVWVWGFNFLDLDALFEGRLINWVCCKFAFYFNCLCLWVLASTCLRVAFFSFDFDLYVGRLLIQCLWNYLVVCFRGIVGWQLVLFLLCCFVSFSFTLKRCY